MSRRAWAAVAAGLLLGPQASAQQLVPGQTIYSSDAVAVSPTASASCPVSGSWIAGALVPTSDGTLCYAPEGGSPPTWVEVGSTIGAAALASSAPGTGWMDGTDVEARLDDGSADLATVNAAAAAAQADIDAHVADGAGAHADTAVSVDSTGWGIDPVTTVHAALDALDAAVTAAQGTADAAVAAAALAATGGAALVGIDSALFAASTGVTLQAWAASIDTALDAHIDDASGAHASSAIGADQTGRTYGLGADVDAALDGLDAQLVTVTGTASAAAVSAALADATAPDEGALLVGTSDTGTGYAAGATVEARLDDASADIGTAQAAAVAAQGDATTAIADALAAQNTADAAIPESLASASGDYLRATADDTWGVRTTAQTQGDLDLLSLTVAASTGAGDGAALVGSRTLAGSSQRPRSRARSLSWRAVRPAIPATAMATRPSSRLTAATTTPVRRQCSATGQTATG